MRHSQPVHGGGGRSARVQHQPATIDARVRHFQCRGFVSTIDYVLDAVSNSIALDYDDAGRTQQIHYPKTGGGTPIVAQYRYDTAAGILVGLDEVGSSATRPIWQLTDSIQGYLIGHETFGNGAVTAYDYDPGRRWVDSIHTTLGSNAQTLDYTHYTNGLMKARTTPGLTRTYSYDGLNRLSSTLDQPITGNGVSTSYTYDPIGNLTGRGATTYTFDPARPHLLATAGGNSYHYDTNGVLDQRGGPDVPRGIQTIDSAPFDLPIRIKGGPAGSVSETDFDYTADEERVVRADATGNRYYAGDLYERLANSSGGSALEERFKLQLGSRQVAEIVRQGGSDKTLFFHADAIGTVSAISDGSGAWFTQEFDPFGSAVSATNPTLTRAGFTGQMQDRDLGFIDMKGRIYDPIAARFTSADPIMQAPYFSQGLNSYAYAFNDPVNNVDPSGFDTYTFGADVDFSASHIFHLGYTTASGSAVFPSAAGGGGTGAALGAGLLGAALNVGAKLLFGGYSQWDAHPGGTYNVSSGVRAATSTGAGQGSTIATAQNRGGPAAPGFSGIPEPGGANGLSPAEFKFIEGHEGFSPRLYNDTGNNATIGKGHLVHYGPVGTDPAAEAPFANGITKAQALQLFQNDLTPYVNGVRALVKVPLTQFQFDALVSFTYNAGVGGLQNSQLLQTINSGNYTDAQIQQLFGQYKYVKVNGVKVVDPGLVNRRADEALLFNTGQY